MPIPDFQTIMLPLLAHYGDRKVRTNQETHVAISEHFGLSDEQGTELLPY